MSRTLKQKMISIVHYFLEIIDTHIPENMFGFIARQVVIHAGKRFEFVLPVWQLR